jgi:hypothetical protein
MSDLAFQITADDSAFLQAIKDSQRACQDAAESIKGSLESVRGSFSTITTAAKAFAAVLTGGELGRVMGEIAERAEKIAVSASELGIGTTQLQGLQVVAAQTGISSDNLSRELLTLRQRLVQAGETGGFAAERFTNLGLTTGQLLDPTLSVVTAMEIMGRASNSNAALTAVLGARASGLIPVMRQLAADHGLLARAFEEVGGLTETEINQLRAYREGLDLNTVAWQNFSARVSLGVVPALEAAAAQLLQFATNTKTAGEFADVLQGAIVFVGEEVIAFIGQVKDIAAAFNFVFNVGKSVFGGLGAAIKDYATLQVGKAVDDIRGAATGVSAAWNQMFASFEANAKQAGDRFRQFKDTVTAPPPQAAPIPQQSAQTNPLPDKSADKFDSEWTQALKDISKKTNEMAEAQARDITRANAEGLDGQVKAAQDAAQAKIAAAQEAFRTGRLTADQELAAVRGAIEEEKRIIEERYTLEEALAAGDLAKVQEIENRKVAAINAANAKLRTNELGVDRTISEQWQRMVDRMASSFATGIEQMLSRQKSFVQVAKSLGQEWLSATIQTQAKAAAQSLTLQGGATTKVIFNDALSAASGAYNAMASIPYVGPALGAAAAAATFAAVMAFGAQVKSSAGGYDVDRDTLGFLHADETVLPKSLSDTYRAAAASLTGQDDGGGRGGDFHFHNNVNTPDPRSAMQYFTSPRGRSALVAGLRAHVTRGGRL